MWRTIEDFVNNVQKSVNNYDDATGSIEAFVENLNNNENKNDPEELAQESDDAIFEEQMEKKGLCSRKMISRRSNFKV